MGVFVFLSVVVFCMFLIAAMVSFAEGEYTGFASAMAFAVIFFLVGITLAVQIEKSGGSFKPEAVSCEHKDVELT
jgi:fumarate reductase subunit C